MDKKRMYQILSVLTLPYCNPNFFYRQRDVIADIRKRFFEVSNRMDLSWSRAEKLKKKYEKAEEFLKDFIFRQSEGILVDDYRLMLNLFFKETESNRIFEKYGSFGDEAYLMSMLYMKNLDRIAESLLTFRDGKVAIRMWVNEKKPNEEEDIFAAPNVYNKVEIWNLLARIMPLDILIVIFLVHNKLYEEDYLYMQNGVIFLGDNILEEVLKKGISETHLHFNAGMQYQYIWQNYMNPLKWDLYDRTNVIKYLYGKDRKENIPFHVVFYRTVFAEYLENIQNYVSFNEFIKVQFCNEKVSVRNFLVKFAEGDTENCGEDISEIYNILRRYQKRYADAGQDFLMDMVYDRYKNLHTYGEMIFLFKSVKYFSIRGIDKDAIIEMRLFMQYLRCKNRLFRRILQSRPIYGLDYFQNKYRGVIENELALRLNQGQICHILFRSIHQNIFLKKYEIRLAIAELKESVDTKYQKEELKRRILKDIYVILKEYKKILEEASESEVPNMGIIFSFLKRDSIDNRIGDMCWLQYDETKINSKSIDHIILKRKRMKDSAEALEELRSEIPFLNNYVVGIDTASIENRAEPWIFAPVYLAIRRQRITKPVMPINSKYAYINNIGLTFHVGEEFRHILSGMRHIYEVISFMGFKAGDRIGHGIALGEDIKRWIEKHETIIIPAGEWLEDLVWLWGVSISGELNIQIYTEQISKEIFTLAEKIYGKDENLTLEILYEAYLKKFRLWHDNIFENMREYCKDNNKQGCVENTHFCKYYNSKENVEQHWNVDKVLCAYFCPVYYQRMRQSIVIHVDQEKYSLYKQVQEEILRIIAQKGIFVEVNPTSNTAIGENRELFMHHVLNLNNHGLVDEDPHEVMVTINSDDPLIFSTNCENEMAYIYHALLSKGYSRERVIKWIDKVREYGLSSSFVKDIRTREKLIRELEIVLGEIEKRYKI